MAAQQGISVTGIDLRSRGSRRRKWPSWSVEGLSHRGTFCSRISLDRPEVPQGKIEECATQQLGHVDQSWCYSFLSSLVSEQAVFSGAAPSQKTSRNLAQGEPSRSVYLQAPGRTTF